MNFVCGCNEWNENLNRVLTQKTKSILDDFWIQQSVEWYKLCSSIRNGEILTRKSGTLQCSTIMQKIRNASKQFLKYLKTDQRQTYNKGQNMWDHYNSPSCQTWVQSSFAVNNKTARLSSKNEVKRAKTYLSLKPKAFQIMDSENYIFSDFT